MSNTANYLRRGPRKQRRSRVTIPNRVGPHARLVFSEINRQGFTYDEVEEGSGVLRSTLKAWRVKNRPGLETLEAVFGFLGWDFLPVPRASVLPPALFDDLRPLAERHGASMELAICAFIGIAARERGLHTEALPFVPALRPYQPPADPTVTFGASAAGQLGSGLSCAA